MSMGGGGSQTQEAKPWAPAVPYVTQGLGEAQNIYSQQKQLAPFSGQLYARPGENIQGAQAMTLGMIPQVQQTAGQVSGYGSDVLGGKYLDVASNPALQGYMQAATQPLQQQLLEQILPSIGGGAIQAGGYGGSRQGIAEGQAIGRYLQEAGNITGRMAGEAYGQERQLQQAAPQLLAQGMQMGLLAPELMGQVGQQQQAAQQGILQEAFTLDQLRRTQPWEALQQYQGLVNPIAGMGGTAVSTPEANPLGGAAGGAMIGNQLLPGGWGTAIGAGAGFLLS